MTTPRTLLGVAVAVMAMAGCGTTSGGSGGAGTTSSSTATAAPPLAGLEHAATGAPVDGIECQTMEQVLFHIHAHLAVYVDGRARGIPEGIGIAPPRHEVQTPEGPFVDGGSCYYWLHGHTADGIIHIESPVQRTLTLGNWFDLWGQPLSATRVGPATGTVIAYVNGQRYGGELRSIPLDAHALIQLDAGRDVPPQPFTFPAGL
ncbi:MAG TPA: hypothetical protein VGP96_00565 [Candidatus Dormibacteraeota bacterium]|nr:hypothetical protein [Candidatus Dormibacteraeota bacterium]